MKKRSERMFSFISSSFIAMAGETFIIITFLSNAVSGKASIDPLILFGIAGTVAVYTIVYGAYVKHIYKESDSPDEPDSPVRAVIVKPSDGIPEKNKKDDKPDGKKDVKPDTVREDMINEDIGKENDRKEAEAMETEAYDRFDVDEILSEKGDTGMSDASAGMKRRRKVAVS